MKKRLLLIVACMVCASFYSHSQMVLPPAKLQIGLGFSYNIPITTDYNSTIDAFFLDVPFGGGVDFRFSETFSLFTGVSFLYGLHAYQDEIENDDLYTVYLHYMFIRIPLIARFYPLVNFDYTYENFYIGLGGFLHFWPVNMYYITGASGSESSGNGYTPGHDLIPPGNIYTPANIGIQIAVGNYFNPDSRVMFGLELNFNYLLIPYINGYYFGENYNRGAEVILDFNASVGVAMSIAVQIIE